MAPTCFSSVVLYREWMWPLRVSRVSLARLPTSLLSGIVSTVSTVSTVCVSTSTAGCRMLVWKMPGRVSCSVFVTIAPSD